MDHKLLSLALTVSRHSEGHYYWVILESFDHSSEFISLLEAAAGFPTYIGALEAGYAVLTDLVGDLNTGPRDDVTDERD